MARYNRYNDHAPLGNTCPIIDSVIGKMESAKNEAEYILKHSEEDTSREASIEIIGQLEDAIKEIEDVRSANEELREWGNDEFLRAEEAEEARDDAIDEKEHLEDEIDRLKDRVNELEDELSQVETA